MPKNNLNSWVGTTMQPQFQTYQTAGMLQPAQPAQPTQAPPPPPTSPAPTPQTGTGSQIFTPPPVGAPAFPPPVTTQPQTQPTSPFTGQQPTTGIVERDRLIDALVGMQFQEQ